MLAMPWRVGQPAIFQRGEALAALWAARAPLALAAALSLVVNVLLLTPTLYLLQVYDRVLVGRNETTLLAASLFALGLLLFVAAGEWLRTRELIYADRLLDQDLGARVFALGFELQWRHARGDAHRPLDDLTQVRQFLSGPGMTSVFDAPWVPLYLGALFLLHPALGGLGVAFAFVQMAVLWFGHRKAVAPARAAAQAAADASRFLQGKLRNAALIEAMGMRDALRRRWAFHHAGARAQSASVQDLTHAISACSKFIRYSQQSLALALGAWLVIDGALSPGAMIAACMLVTRALAPIDQFVSGWRGFVGARDALARLDSLLNRFPAAEGPVDAGTVPRSGPLTLTGVVARAPGREQLILRGVDLALAEGRVLVVQGDSGSGKSTLARVLVGCWPDVEGEVMRGPVRVDGAAYRPAADGIGYLPQEVELLEGTVAENIARHGVVDAEKVIAAARCAALHEHILKLPQGYDTPVGDAADALSGGQRQRIGLARAWYGEPALVVLDEPDAHLDEAGEAALRAAVAAMKACGSTVVLISHHPALLAIADRLLVLDKGQVRVDRDLHASPGGSPAPFVLSPALTLR